MKERECNERKKKTKEEIEKDKERQSYKKKATTIRWIVMSPVVRIPFGSTKTLLKFTERIRMSQLCLHSK